VGVSARAATNLHLPRNRKSEKPRGVVGGARERAAATGVIAIKGGFSRSRWAQGARLAPRRRQTQLAVGTPCVLIADVHAEGGAVKLRVPRLR